MELILEMLLDKKLLKKFWKKLEKRLLNQNQSHYLLDMHKLEEKHLKKLFTNKGGIYAVRKRQAIYMFP